MTEINYGYAAFILITVIILTVLWWVTRLPSLHVKTGDTFSLEKDYRFSNVKIDQGGRIILNNHRLVSNRLIIDGIVGE